MSNSEDLARNRFMLISLARFGAIAMVMVGIANMAGKLLPDLKPWFGYFLFFLGVGGFYMLPVMLKRRWRSGEE